MPDDTNNETYATEVLIPAGMAADQIGNNDLAQQVVPQQHATILGTQTDGLRVMLGDGREVPLLRRAHGRQATVLSLTATTEEIRDAPSERILARGRWVSVPGPTGRDQVRDSYLDAFRFRDPDTGKELRPPQAGAVHSVLGYWTTAPTEPATVVMPTGTGKTDTMISIFAATRPELLLVVVPSDALRTQIGSKFESMGVLPGLGLLAPEALPLVVGQIKHRFADAAEAEAFAAACNVVIATPQVLTDAGDGAAAFLAECTHLFVDEAHHVAAATWQTIRDRFDGKPVVQFTATPFREDGRHLGGRVIYAFPLREAQAQGYFSRINYLSVPDLGQHDRAIAERAVRQLREDLNNGYDHVLMARVSRVGRADDLLPIYRSIAPDLNPVLMHSNANAGDRRAAVTAMRDRTSRIIVCVNMLGEGFDLPELKVAAIHDPHKSIGITLQFVGRFARSASGLGDASVVVGRPERDYDPELRKLFAEDADWNRIVRDLSEGAVSSQQEVSDFEEAFGQLPEEVSMRSLFPKMSTVVYKVPGDDDWTPEAILAVFPEDHLLTVPIAINLRDGVAWFVVENRTEVRWADLRTVEEVTYDLYVLYWNEDTRLLYINSTNNDSVHETLAQAVCGPDTEIIKGEQVYRVMGEATRLVPINIGVLDVRNRSRRFMMLVGANVSEGLPLPGEPTKTQTNIFALGYEHGGRVAIGASLKGRVWSYRVADNLKQWVDWCDDTGRRLLDDTISIENVIRNFVRPQILETRPETVVIGLEWHWSLYENVSEGKSGEYDDTSHFLIDLEFVVTSFDPTGPITFDVVSADWRVPYTLTIADGAMKFRAVRDDVDVVTPRTRRTLTDYLNEEGLLIHLADDATIMPPAILLRPTRDVPPYNPADLHDLDWDGIDLQVESQGRDRRIDSVQARMIRHIDEMADWDMIIDDDGSGEAADIVAIRIEDNRLVVHLTHCKWVQGGAPRAQVIDLYEVCGQAQKSTKWRQDAPTLFQHLRRRERLRVQGGRPTGLMKGSAADLYRLEDRSIELEYTMTIAVAQPGLSKTRVSTDQLALLASTATYLHETAFARFEAFCSP